MRRILALVEGQTELATLNRLLAPHLGMNGYSFQPKVTGKPGHKGGVRSYATVVSEILALLKQERRAVVTTFFDLYALVNDWPGWSPPKTKASSQRAAEIEQGIRDDIRAKIDSSDDPRRFIPYLQVHELEALLFAEPRILAECLGQAQLESALRKIVADCGGCEQIDDSPETAPSKRLEKIFPSYKKGEGQRAHAPIAIGRIGLISIRQACPRFHSWLQQLEGIDAVLAR